MEKIPHSYVGYQTYLRNGFHFVDTAFDFSFHKFLRKEVAMSQSNTEDLKDTQSKESPIQNPSDEFPWFTTIMVVIGLIAASVAFAQFVNSLITVGYWNHWNP